MPITKENVIVADHPVDHSEVLPTAPDKPLVESYFEALRTRVATKDLAESTVIAQIQDTRALIVICSPTNAERFHKALAKVEGVESKLIVLDDPAAPNEYPNKAGIPLLSDLLNGFGELVIGGMRHEVVFFRDSDLVKDIKLILKACDQFNITKMIMGTHHVAQLAAIKDAVPSGLNVNRVRVIIPVGTSFHPHMSDEVKTIFPNVIFVNCYSMTEVAFLVSMSLSLTCLGPVMEGHEVKIVDPNTREALKPHQVGEIMIKPPYPFPGYLNKPEETAKFCEPDGFCHSGDFGHYDEDGLLYFDGRMKEIIKFKNNHIHPFELETLIQQLPGVEEVGVYGEPDPASQELATAVVRLTPGCQMSENEIIEAVAAKVDDFKQLRGGVRFVEKELPRNAMGKLLRRNLNSCK
ncbi:hypothetical protein TCAL_15166 [Tigriopus californicus]|uniref:AMP-dependent synthetase/ligase domain-containing protein n=1 Tax=Tigriopus californicus TaxID=6832 RepID=A0A553NU30_TIGCA|nr:hypothetical protein TCAL_15166 [Tigriopus californicus]